MIAIFKKAPNWDVTRLVMLFACATLLAVVACAVVPFLLSWHRAEQRERFAFGLPQQGLIGKKLSEIEGDVLRNGFVGPISHSFVPRARDYISKPSFFDPIIIRFKIDDNFIITDVYSYRD